MKRWTIWLPLGLFALFFVVVAIGLRWPSDDIIASKMIGKPLPEFDLPPALSGGEGLRTADFKTGKPKLLNIFASWCVPCMAEAPYLEQLAKAGVEIDGIAIRDRAADVAAFLDRNGNPYSRIGTDDVSKVQIEIGSSGVPETFLIDGNGTILHQHVGDIRAEDVPKLLAMVKDAQ